MTEELTHDEDSFYLKGIKIGMVIEQTTNENQFLQETNGGVL